VFRSLKHWLASLAQPADTEPVAPQTPPAGLQARTGTARSTRPIVDNDRHENDAGNMTLDITPSGFDQPVKLTVTMSTGFGPQASRTPHSRDRSAKNLPDLTYGYPERPDAPPAPAPFAECKIYYGQYTNFDAAQKRYYLWWRYNFDAGVVLPTTDTYLFVAGYEAPVFAATLQAVLDRWVALWLAYPDARSFRSYCANWVESMRSVMGLAIYDDITLSLARGQRRFDAAVSTGVPPEIEDVIACCRPQFDAAIRNVRPDRLRRAMQALRTADGPDRVLAAARANAPQALEGGFDNGFFPRPGQSECYAAAFIPGCQRSMIGRNSLLMTRVRICKTAWQPRSVHRIFCFFTKRRLTT
jgi:hypothetical protein